MEEGIAKCIRDTYSCRGPNARSKFQLLAVVEAVYLQQNLSAIELDLLRVARAVHPSNPSLKKGK